QVLEIGKQWDQAHADVAEAIDFLEYYGREMIRLGEHRRLGEAPAEINHYLYEPRGVAAVIAPWNFPLAISTGMTAAAIVTGNPVVYKPSSLTPIIGHQLVEVFRLAGLPEGVFNYVPGRSGVMGDFLVDHPDIALIAFTGSMEVGLRIIERAARVHPGQHHVKRVITEMGGKNAIIIDADADLDEAVGQVLSSAFGFQGQKCSACSRVIVLDAIHDRFVERLIGAARAWRIGPAEDPAFSMGAVADGDAQRKIMEYIAIGEREGRLLYRSDVPVGEGYWVPLTIIGDITPGNRLAQEEVFGPVLAVMRVRDFDQAIQWANATRYALTGGLFSRSPRNIEHARRAFRVGNLYINRGVTGALVERQPFGGAAMSGAGTKAGGPDYLRHFMDPRVVTENTMRRGFAPTGG
ncbi:MAG TPA: aldehyde dehydrogenase family protein, partial [Desulfuromonadaceae bacterium]